MYHKLSSTALASMITMTPNLQPHLVCTPPPKNNCKFLLTLIRYAVSAVLAKTMSWLDPLGCSVAFLRFTNLVFVPLLYGLAYALAEGQNRWLTALNICLLPPLHFFVYLYYTDVGSVAMVLLAYWLAIKRDAHVSSALAAAFSVAFRQTNIIWTFFIAGISLVNALERKARQHVGLLNLIPLVFQHFGLALDIAFPYLAVFGGFVYYIYWNDGRIVLGDAENHIAGLHIPQLFYFVAFCIGMLLPVFHIAPTIKFFRKRVRTSFSSLIQSLLSVLSLALMAFSVHRFTYDCKHNHQTTQM